MGVSRRAPDSSPASLQARLRCTRGGVLGARCCACSREAISKVTRACLKAASSSRLAEPSDSCWTFALMSSRLACCWCMSSRDATPSMHTVNNCTCDCNCSLSCATCCSIASTLSFKPSIEPAPSASSSFDTSSGPLVLEPAPLLLPCSGSCELEWLAPALPSARLSWLLVRRACTKAMHASIPARRASKPLICSLAPLAPLRTSSRVRWAALLSLLATGPTWATTMAGT
mmetsp:Transcript_24130/g.66065  ORF Transcript_24130/g.66065 Transcript_24130/m.66065 type:complete len:230 (-) Transcript_24130:7-696(-)